jgi:hypothetical protein
MVSLLFEMFYQVSFALYVHMEQKKTIYAYMNIYLYIFFIVKA